MTASKNVAQRLFENNDFVQDYFDFYDEATETFQELGFFSITTNSIKTF